MDFARRRQIDALLDGALDRAPGERRQWLESECAADRTLLREVLALLRAAEAGGGILDRGVGELAAGLLERPRPPRPIGPYRILDELGRGGMSVVYRAERSDGHFRRTVALKVLRWEFDAEELHRRLAAERQILAALDHPNIARLLDGGATEDGRPYLVVEYVEGRPVTEFCDSRRLPVEERLRLFVQVARAVQHAHARLVVHRDLKPSNILVDDHARVRLLDFGIAKVLDVGEVELEGEEVPVTGAGMRLFTPEYASPEQLRGDPASVAYDVWALGVVLCELLTGARPFAGSRLGGALEREILEGSPTRPSTLARSTDPSVTTLRGATPKQLAKRLEGDLDRIVGMAVRREPERRYPSADQLAEDVERYLGGLPVRAQPDRRGYRVRKFLGRHRVESTLAALAAAAVFVGTGVALWQAREAGLERDRAEVAAARSEAVAEYVLDLFRTADPWELPAERLTARQLLARGEARLASLPADSVLRARVLLALGQTYAAIGDPAAARPLLEEAVELRRAALGDRHSDTAEALRALGDWLRRAGRMAEAEALALQALEASDSARGDHLGEAAALDLLGFIHTSMGHTDQAMADFEAELAVLRRAGAHDAPEVANVLVNLAAVNRRLGRFEEAEQLLREALDHRTRLLGPDDPLTATGRARLAGLLSEHMGRYEEAIPLFQEALEVQTRALGADHPARGEPLTGLAVAHERMGDLATAEGSFRETVRTLEAGFGAEHPSAVGAVEALAAFLGRVGRLAEADSIYSETVPWRLRTLGEGHPSYAGSLSGWGRVQLGLGRLAAAEASFGDALRIREEVFGPEHALVGLAMVDLAELHGAAGREAERIRLLEEALSVLEAFHPPGHPETVEVRGLLAEARVMARRDVDGEP